MNWLIWSNEHRAWWAPNRMGYTTATHRAGRYNTGDALEIVNNANKHLAPGTTPNEIMVHAPSRNQAESDLTADLEWPQAERVARVDQTLAGQLSRAMQSNARMEAALLRIIVWSEAYPLDIFPEPDFKKAHELLQAGGITLDTISASNMRHVIGGVGKIAREALE